MKRVENLNLRILKFNHKEEEHLINKAINGNSRAFSELIKKHKVYLYKIAYSYVKNENNALDIVQESVYRGLLNINKLKKPNYFKTWITRIVINCSIDFINKEGREVQLDDEVIEKYEETYLEEKLDLYNAIDLLKDDYKTVIILKYFNDITIENISKIMDIPENTVKTYLRRARHSLSKILKEDYLNE